MSWNGRLAQAASKYGENAPMAATCCNACRTCVQTNLIALAIGSVVAAGSFVAHLVKRPPDSPSE